MTENIEAIPLHGLIDATVVEEAWSDVALTAAAPQILQILAGLTDTRLKIAFHRLTKGDLTPQDALTILIELKTYHDLGAKLRSRTKERA